MLGLAWEEVGGKGEGENPCPPAPSAPPRLLAHPLKMNWPRLFKNRKPPPATSDARRRLPAGTFRNQAPLPDGAEPPEFIRIVPIGRFPAHPDGDHEITAEHIAEMAANFTRVDTDVLVDIDHESWWGQTRAAGWITGVEARDDGLYGRYPEWTPHGEPFIDNREYRYLSPLYRLNDRSADDMPVGARLLSVALTNMPYMDEGQIDVIGNSASDDPDDDNPNNPDTMDRKQLAAQLGLAEDATDEQIAEAIKALQDNQKSTDASDEGDPSGSGASAGDPAAAAAAEGASGDGQAASAEAIELAVANAVKKQLKAAGVPEREEALVDQAVADGKILPAQRAVWLNSARADFSATKQVLEATRKNAALPKGGGIRASRGADEGDAAKGRARVLANTRVQGEAR